MIAETLGGRATRSLRPVVAFNRPLAIGAAALAATVAAVGGCGGEDENGGGANGGGVPISDPGPIHVHGLGVNPRDGALFIATHTGLFRADRDESRASRVGDRYQDTMGFTVVGPDLFLGSGHPDARTGDPPFLGLIRSQDAGRTWEPVSLRGDADFHVLEASGDVVYGFGSDYDSRRIQFLVSADGGKTWDERHVPEPLIALAIHPRDAEHVVAAGERGLHESSDGGRRWRELGKEPGLVDWQAADRLAMVTPRGETMTSRDGRTWSRGAPLGGQPAAFEAERDGLYVALHDGTVKRSTDGGRSWAIRSRP